MVNILLYINNYYIILFLFVVENASILAIPTSNDAIRSN